MDSALTYSHRGGIRLEMKEFRQFPFVEQDCYPIAPGGGYSINQRSILHVPYQFVHHEHTGFVPLLVRLLRVPLNSGEHARQSAGRRAGMQGLR